MENGMRIMTWFKIVIIIPFPGFPYPLILPMKHCVMALKKYPHTRKLIQCCTKAAASLLQPNIPAMGLAKRNRSAPQITTTIILNFILTYSFWKELNFKRKYCFFRQYKNSRAKEAACEITVATAAP